MSHPLASISLDLDDMWTYLKTHGDHSWETYPSYLSYAVPRMLDFFDQHQIKITFFLVAQDAVFAKNQPYLRAIAERGHDIGNHTFHHDPWLHLYTPAQIAEELASAEYHIEAVTGIRPRGFRGPGFSFSPEVLQVLSQRDYVYDASTFPSVLNSLARSYFLRNNKLSKAERHKRKGLFGSWKDGLRPNKPYFWRLAEKTLLEIPVTTMPIFKIPIHASYILYLSTFSQPLAFFYLRFALWLCKLTKIQPSILLHPLDFIGCDDTDQLAFFPAMRIESAQKLRIMHQVFRILKRNFYCVDMKTHAETLLRETHSKITAIKKEKIHSTL